MLQSSLHELSKRLTHAIDAHPNAPTGVFGRQRWLKLELEQKAGIVVSPNTVSKWINGKARPREDKLLALARVLSVDIVWLTHGKTPLRSPDHVAEQVHNANAAMIGLMYFVMSRGGNAIANPDGATLTVMMEGESTRICPLSPHIETATSLSFIFPEPMECQIVGLVSIPDELASTTHCTLVIDLTDIERESFGGFSVVTLEKCGSHGFRAKNATDETKPLSSINALVVA